MWVIGIYAVYTSALNARVIALHIIAPLMSCLRAYVSNRCAHLSQHCRYMAVRIREGQPTLLGERQTNKKKKNEFVCGGGGCCMLSRELATRRTLRTKPFSKCYQIESLNSIHNMHCTDPSTSCFIHLLLCVHLVMFSIASTNFYGTIALNTRCLRSCTCVPT